MQCPHLVAVYSHSIQVITCCMLYKNNVLMDIAVRSPRNFNAFAPTNSSVMLEWSPPEPLSTQNIHLEGYELW